MSCTNSWSRTVNCIAEVTRITLRWNVTVVESRDVGSGSVVRMVSVSMTGVAAAGIKSVLRTRVIVRLGSTRVTLTSETSATLTATRTIFGNINWDSSQLTFLRYRHISVSQCLFQTFSEDILIPVQFIGSVFSPQVPL